MSVLWPLPLIATVLRPPVGVAIVLWSCAGLLCSYHLLANLLFAQALAPSMRGRAFAFARSLMIAAQGLGLLIAGLVGEWTNPATAVGLAGLTGAVICAPLATCLRLPGRHRICHPVVVSSSQILGSRNYGMAVAALDEVTPAQHLRSDLPPTPRSRALLVATGWRTFAVSAISIAIVALVAIIVFGGWLPHFATRAPLRLPWWILAAGIAVAYLFGIPFQRGREALSVNLGQIPIVLGLLLSSPSDLFVAVMVGACAIYVRQPLVAVKFFVNRATGAVEVGVAVGVFALLRPGHNNGWSALIAAFIACLAADLCGAISVNLLRKLFDPSHLIREMVRPLVFLLISGMAASSLGLLSVAAIWTRPTYGLLLVLVAALVIGGSRAYADLQERHQGLNQLYEFQGQLGPLLPRVSELHPVLVRTRDILTASQVELVIEEENDPQRAPGRRRTITVDSSGLLREFWREIATEDAEKAEERLTVALSAGGRRLGTLSVRDRLGSLRGYNRSDLHLLETIGTHVSNALDRGRLLERLQEAATHDSLTGLLTLNELSRVMDENLIRGESCALVLCDVARLKDINDSLGHDAGDALLCTVAERLRDYTSANALIARAGGGEFAVAFTDISVTDATTAVSRIATGLSGLVQVLGVTVDLRTRLGWAVTPEDGVDSADLLRRADLALGSAKRELHRAARYGPELEVDGLRRLRLVNDLRAAIDAREIDVAFQPLVTPHDGNVIGAEALARWQHHEFGPLPPDEFIAVAEQSGLIGPLTELVLDKALARTRAWHLEGRDLRVAVNLSPRCLADLGLPGLVLDLLARHRVEPSQLTLEITESSVAEDPGRAETVLARLRGLGVRLSIDDFGTGYSTLASLKRFPVQEVKLDRQFLIDLDKAPVEGSPTGVDIALLTAIVALGHSLELEIVAEGVETEEVYIQLRALGVDVLQGYFIGRPLVGGSLPTQCLVNAEDPRPMEGSGSLR
jgi:diguanylate cyclase (GGDEF)-like protein